MTTDEIFAKRYPTDKELLLLLPRLPLEQRIEVVIRKYIGGTVSSAHNGENTSAEADRLIARRLLHLLRPWLAIAGLAFIFRFYSVDQVGKAWLLETRHVEAACVKDVPVLEPRRGAQRPGLLRFAGWDWEGRSCYARDIRLPEGPDGRWQMTVARSPNGNESAPARFTISKGVVK